MKKKIVIGLCLISAIFLAGGAYIVFAIESAAKRLDDLIKDLRSVEMGTAVEFLSYFVMGTKGLRAFSRDGIVNTDDNLYLEFSAPKSVGVGSVMGANVWGLARYRESIVPYLSPAKEEKARKDQKRRWDRRMEAARVYDRAHSLFLEGRYKTEEFGVLLAGLEKKFPEYAPGKFIKNDIYPRWQGPHGCSSSPHFPCWRIRGKGKSWRSPP